MSGELRPLALVTEKRGRWGKPCGLDHKRLLAFVTELVFSNGTMYRDVLAEEAASRHIPASGWKLFTLLNTRTAVVR